MKWNDLSMKEKAAIIKVAVNNNLTNIEDIRKEYNVFADGGEIDNIHSTPAQTFIASWLSNRQKQFQENFRNSGSTMIPYSILPKKWSNKAAFNEYQNQLRNLHTVKQYDVLGNTKFLHIPDSEFEAIKHLSNHTGGAYNPSTHSISYIDPYAGTDIHELTHSLNATPQLNTIRYGFEENKLQEGKQYNPYKDSADEIYSRLMQFRYLNKLDPKKEYTIGDIKKWREKYDDTDIINRYNDEYLLYLLNNVASTKSSVEKNGMKLAAYGGDINKGDTKKLSLGTRAKQGITKLLGNYIYATETPDINVDTKDFEELKEKVIGPLRPIMRGPYSTYIRDKADSLSEVYWKRYLTDSDTSRVERLPDNLRRDIGSFVNNVVNNKDNPRSHYFFSSDGDNESFDENGIIRPSKKRTDWENGRSIPIWEYDVYPDSYDSGELTPASALGHFRIQSIDNGNKVIVTDRYDFKPNHPKSEDTRLLHKLRRTADNIFYPFTIRDTIVLNRDKNEKKD